MEFTGLTVEEIIEYLFKEQDHISTIDITNALDACSAVDPYAGKDALTIFYSGGEDEIVNAIAKTNNSKVRLIRRTDGFKLMTSSRGHMTFDDIVIKVITRENPSLSPTQINEKVRNFLFKSSAANDPNLNTDELGLWTKLSSRFAEGTTGDAYSLCSDAAENRIFSRDELKH